MISEFLRGENALTQNLHILSNQYVFNDEGVIQSYDGQIIHTFSKGHVDLSSFAYTRIVKEHKHVLVLGDSLADIDMIENIPHDVALKIGFLEENIEKNLDRYRQVYDVVITNDGDFAFIKELLESLE
jgi:5'-nucleotidase